MDKERMEQMFNYITKETKNIHTKNYLAPSIIANMINLLPNIPQTSIENFVDNKFNI